MFSIRGKGLPGILRESKNCVVERPRVGWHCAQVPAEPAGAKHQSPFPEGLSTQYLRTRVPNTTKGMVSGDQRPYISGPWTRWDCKFSIPKSTCNR